MNYFGGVRTVLMGNKEVVVFCCGLSNKEGFSSGFIGMGGMV